MCKKLVFLASFVLVLSLTTTVANADISDGLVGYWPLDEGAGTTTEDLSGNENHGTFLDSPTWVSGKFGGALDFDGTDDVVDCGNPTVLDFGTGDWTVSAWIKVSVNPGDDRAIFSKGMETSPNTDYQMRLRDEDGGDVMIRIDNDGTRYNPVTGDAHAENLIDGQWHHIVGMRRDLTKLRVYVDGVEDMGVTNHGESTIPDSFDLSGTSQHNAYIGAVAGGAGNPRRFFVGLIDDVAVWNRALTAEEVTYLWNNGDGNTAALGDPEKASNPNPADKATVDLSDATPLSWTAGEYAVEHDVYFGAAFDDVNDADANDTTGIYRGRQSLPIYNPTEALELGQTYFWRIDEVSAPPDYEIYKGNVWRFTIANYRVVDDMEAYNYSDNLIWHAWKDGEGWTQPSPGWGGNGSGSVMDIGTDFAQDVQSLSYSFDNDGTNSLGTTGKAFYSEAKKTLTDPRDWTAQGVKALSLLFRGYPAFLGGFIEAPAGTYAMSGAGEDIWGNSDEFHFAYKELNGAGTIIAKVESVENTHEFAKAGVMIRDTLDPNAANVALLITPGNGVRFQYRNATGDNTDRFFDDTITAPQWVKLERTIGGMIRAYYSPDGNSWTPFDLLSTVTMNLPTYIGLAVTSHTSGVACEAVFSNVTSDGTGQWVNQDIGLKNNDPEQIYVSISNNNGTTGTVYYEDNDNKDPNATLIDDWTEWNIDLKDFVDQGIDLTDVNDITLGVGTKGNTTTPGGSGELFFDNIRLYQPRCILDKVTLLEGDLTSDCVVDFRDLEIMANDWLNGDYTIYAETPKPASAWWEFENNVNGTGGNNGVAYGNPTYGPGKFNQAIIFDGTDDYVVVTDSPVIEFSTGSFSIALWIKSSYAAGSNKQFIICNGTNGSEFDAGGNGPGGRSTGKRYVIKFQDSNFRFLVDDDSTKTTIDGASSKFATGDWVHAAVMSDADAKELRVYCNGELQSSKANATAGDISSPGEPLYIGAKQQEDAHAANSASAPIDHYFEGMLDDLRIYDYALSRAEILGVIGSDLYVPLTSLANISDEEPANSKKVNFRDFAVLADQWLEQQSWPE
jgi:hypothetical protein